VICWDRAGALARNEREARTCEDNCLKVCAPAARLRAGAPAVPANHLSGSGNHVSCL